MVSWQHSVRVEAWAMQQKVLTGLLDGPARGQGQAQAVEVIAESCDGPRPKRYFPLTRLWGGVGAVLLLAHGSGAEGVSSSGFFFVSVLWG